jgi:hypothetical protein
MMKKDYRFIFAGGGLAGLSLASQLVRDGFPGSEILIIDSDSKIAMIALVFLDKGIPIARNQPIDLDAGALYRSGIHEPLSTKPVSLSDHSRD